jgi:hypothetical protein
MSQVLRIDEMPRVIEVYIVPSGDLAAARKA